VVSRRLVFLVCFVLTGCSAATTATPTLAPPAILVTSPALAPWVIGRLKSFASGSGPLTFDLNVRAPSAKLASDETRIQGTPPGSAAFATPLGQEAVVVIVHPDVGKREFSLAELGDIFSGRTSRWELAKGGTGPIQPIIPLPDDSLRLTFENVVMDQAPFASVSRLASDPKAMVDQVSQIPGAIGMIPLSQAADGVRVVRVNGLLADPSQLNASGYPLTFAVIAVGEGPPAEPIYRFLLWSQERGATAKP
jgi:ABC-type phosphate transport system substrate-binding protein